MTPPSRPTDPPLPGPRPAGMLTPVPTVLAVLVSGSAIVLLSIGCAASAPIGPCDRSPRPAGCELPCDDDGDCAAGLYCSATGSCTADCHAEGGSSCGSGQYCSSRGRCEHSGGDGSTGAAEGGAAEGRGGSGANVCADVEIETRRVTPTVMLIVDQSGSMTERFSDSGDRWTVLRDSLLAVPDGLVHRLQSEVRFGLALYSASEDSDECPHVDTVAPAIDNYGAIEDVYGAAEPLEETPTGDAIEAVLEETVGAPDRDPDPTIFVLATDGEPDRCEELNPNPTPEAQREAVSSVERAHRRGIRTYLIDVGNEVGPEHKQDVANAGLGRGPGDPDAPYWTVTDDEGLVDALRSIVGGVLDCELELEGAIDDLDDACSGTVELNGRELPCEEPDGWRAVDERHIELLGEACETIKTTPGATIEATFPCETVLI